jgi:hypothetical protein
MMMGKIVYLRNVVAHIHTVNYPTINTNKNHRDSLKSVRTVSASSACNLKRLYALTDEYVRYSDRRISSEALIAQDRKETRSDQVLSIINGS